MKKGILVLVVCMAVCTSCTAAEMTETGLSAAVSGSATAAAEPSAIAEAVETQMVSDQTGDKAADQPSVQPAENQSSKKEQLVSRSYFIENSGYSEQELDGIEIEEFITEHQVTAAYMKTSEFKDSLSGWVDLANKYCEKKGKYSYLKKTPLKIFDKAMLENIKIFYIADVYEGYENIILFDFEDNMVCRGSSLNYQREEMQDDREKIISLIAAAGIENITEPDQEKEVEEYQEWVNSYELIIETYDGETAHIKGRNVEVSEYRALAGRYCGNVRAISERTAESDS